MELGALQPNITEQKVAPADHPLPNGYTNSTLGHNIRRLPQCHAVEPSMLHTLC